MTAANECGFLCIAYIHKTYRTWHALRAPVYSTGKYVKFKFNELPRNVCTSCEDMGNCTYVDTVGVS